MSTTKTCTTCGQPADRPYANEAADERCHDPIHTDLLQRAAGRFECDKCGATFEDGIDAGHHEAEHEPDRGRTTWNDDVTVTVTLEVAEALCRAAEFLVEPNPAGPGTVWVSDETGDVFATTDEALIRALPRIAEIGTHWRADNEEMAEAVHTILEGDLEAARDADRTQAEIDRAMADARADVDRENGPNSGDAEQDYHDHVRRLEEAADNRPAVGAKVLFVDALERYPHFTVPAGATGTVTNSDDDYYAVKVDQPIPGAEEWDNEVIWSIGDDEEPGLDLRLAGEFVNHEALAEMSYDDLGKAIAEGGPSELIDALLAERSERQRKADSIYSDEWDANGTISVHLPAGADVNWAGWLETRGWMHRHGKWFSPADEASVWNLDEALQRQLLAEALR